MDNALLQQARGLNNQLTRIRRQIHRQPETGTHLPHTQKTVLAQLEKLGIQGAPCGGSGVTALIQGALPGKTFLLRADMDALPVAEETGLEFAAQNGNMHACGHDCHVAMLLGAAALLLQRRSQLRGSVKLLFQPGEETMEGAKEMVDCGVLENPHVDAAMMVHILSGMDVPNGSCAVFGPGPAYASVDWWRIEIKGKGGHGAQPQETISPLNIMADINTHLNTMVAYGIAADETAVVSCGQMQGGNIANVIPDTATMAGTIRTFSEGVRTQLKDTMAHSIPLLAQAKGGNATVHFGPSAPCVVCNAAVSHSVLGTVRTLVGEGRAFDLATAFDGRLARVSSSEDFAWIAQAVPSAVVWLMAGRPEDGYCYPGHHPKADFDEDFLYIGSAVYAQSAIDWLDANG